MKSLFITAKFGFNTWPISECGPAAVVSNARKMAPSGIFAFVRDRLLIKDRFQRTRIGDVTPARMISIISSDPLDGFTAEISDTGNWVFWIRSDKDGAREAVKVAFDEGSDIVLVPDAKRLFPSKSYSDAARLCLDVAFGSGAVFQEEETVAFTNPALFGLL